MKYEIHCHSKYSPGKHIPIEVFQTPSDVIRTAKKIGLDAIAITDHNSVEAFPEAKKEAKKQGILFIPGEEIDTDSDQHILALGISELIKRGRTPEEVIDKIHDQGGVAISAHPYDIRNEGLKDRFIIADAVEVFNSINLDKFSNYMARRKAEKKGMPMVAGSDAHSPKMIGKSVIISEGYNLDSILKNIRRGQVVMSTSYIPLEAIMEWVRERLIACYSEAMAYIDRKFTEPVASLLKAMARRYRDIDPSDYGWWSYLARLGYSATMAYSGIKTLRYY